MAAKSLFISHISEEAEYAALLKEMIQSDFLDLVECFTSSDIGSIGAGENWLVAVEKAMRNARAVIVLCSKASVHRPWVQFEVGAAWMKGIPVIPVCHSGMRMGELEMPLSLRQGVELPGERSIAKLYAGIARILEIKRPPKPRDLAERLAAMNEIESGHRLTGEQQFERFIDIVLPAPGRLDADTIPDDAVVETRGDSLEIFGFLHQTRLKWRDIVRKAQTRPDTRWLRELQRSIALASNNEQFRPVQAVYHNGSGSYQPHLSKKEVLVDGSSRFHVHFIDTVVAPLADVQNDFGTLATLLRLGLRFRYEVLERFTRLARGRGDVLTALREAIETIENDALSRGAEQLDRDSVMALFESDDDRTVMARVQDAWDRARGELFCQEPLPSRDDVVRILGCMRALNYDFMKLATRRFHELVASQWVESCTVRELRVA